jgi:hypothetical protein
LKGADCFHVSCSKDGKSYNIEFPDSNTEGKFTCTKDEEVFTLKEFDFQIYCADPNTICKNASPCQDDCSSK